MSNDATAVLPSQHHLSADLLARVRAQTGVSEPDVTARHDLDERGRYAEGYLVLAGEFVGSFLLSDGRPVERWWKVADLTDAVMVEGVGMGLLRLLKDGVAVAEYRYSLRHAKEVARFHRFLERKLKGESAAEVPIEHTPPGEEKKIRCETCGRVIPSWSEVCPSCLSKRKVLSRLIDFIKPYWWQAVVGFLLALVGTFAALVRPYLTRPMLDRGLGLETRFQPDYRTLLYFVGIMVVLSVIGLVAECFRERLMATLGSKIGRDIRDRTYAHLHKLSLSYFSRKPTGSLVTRITSDSDRIWDFIAFTLVEAVISIITILGVGTALFILNWRLACIVLIPIPVMFVLMIVFHQRLHAGFHRLFHRWSVMTAVVADALPGVRVIKAFSQEKREVERFGQRNREFYEDEVGMITIWTLFRPVMHLCTQVGTILVWVVGGYWVICGRMTAGTLMAYVGYMWMFYGPIHMVAHMDRMFNRAATSVQRIFEILDKEPAIYSKTGARKVYDVQGRLELQNVTFSYDGVRKVLKNLSLVIEPGEMIGLAGPSGGGKTTLVNLICRFYDPLEGRILLDGVDLRDYDVESLRRCIGVV
ncbi:MAG: ABC transporter transmembrane domain-containing protein, partial [Kiritimatiellae bacterium]|nr:ABC transporter transmembrane domain-containing protein [Kiritimatiellia bacterium]